MLLRSLPKSAKLRSVIPLLPFSTLQTAEGNDKLKEAHRLVQGVDPLQTLNNLGQTRSINDIYTLYEKLKEEGKFTQKLAVPFLDAMSSLRKPGQKNDTILEIYTGFKFPLRSWAIYREIIHCLCNRELEVATAALNGQGNFQQEEKNIEKALQVFSDAVNNGCYGDLKTFNLLLKVLARRKMVKHAEKIFSLNR